MNAEQKQLHFVHGNSFPAGTYRMFLDFLRKDYSVGVTDMIGHDPRYPVTDGWRHLAQELIDTLQARYSKPVILLGHSLGGILCLMAARARPELVRCVIVLDSPIVAGWRAGLLRVAKYLRVDKNFSPARFSAKRKQLWVSREEAYQHFASKQMFALWPEQVLRDYIEAGMVEGEQGVELRFNREIETAIYRTLPHRLGRFLHRPPEVPIGFIGGTHSIECRQAGDYHTRQLMGTHYRLIHGGHLIPMEAPQQTAEAVLDMLISFKLKSLEK